MLWYRAWLESRSRFLIGAGALIVLSVVFVLFHDTLRLQIVRADTPLTSYAAYVHRRPMTLARALCQVFALILGLGGLLREREHGTAAFTLALPVSRARLVAARASIGLLEVAALALLPALLVPALSPVVHQSYPLSQALPFSLLWIAGQAAVFALSFLLSTCLAGPYTAFVIGWVALVFHTYVATLPALQAYHLNLNHVESGLRMPYFDPQTAMFVGPLPWLRLSIMALVTVALLALAARLTARQDF